VVHSNENDVEYLLIIMSTIILIHYCYL